MDRAVAARRVAQQVVPVLKNLELRLNGGHRMSGRGILFPEIRLLAVWARSGRSRNIGCQPAFFEHN